MKRTVDFILKTSSKHLQKGTRESVEGGQTNSRVGHGSVGICGPSWFKLVQGSGAETKLIDIEKEFLIEGLLKNKELKLRESFESTFKELANIS